jgi:hypothetical protein
MKNPSPLPGPLYLNSKVQFVVFVRHPEIKKKKYRKLFFNNEIRNILYIKVFLKRLRKEKKFF